MAKEKKPTKDPAKNQKKRSKKVGHKLFEKTFKHENGQTYTVRRKKGNREHNADPRDWGKMTPQMRELSKTIRRFNGKNVQLDADANAMREIYKDFATLSEA